MSAPVQFKTRLWSQECAIADAVSGEPLPPQPYVYEFSNGRKFTDPLPDPYVNFPEPDNP